MGNIYTNRAINVLLFEPNPVDVGLMTKTLEENKIALNITKTTNFVETMEYLFHLNIYKDTPSPDLILIDCNSFRRDGIEIINVLKNEPAFSSIPIVIITLTEGEAEMLETYDIPAACYITKPIDLDQFNAVVHSVTDFWFTVVKPIDNSIN
jgi:two-component system response regulator